MPQRSFTSPVAATGNRARNRITVTVYGIPAPQGSKRHVGNGVMIENNKPTLTTWREDVKLAALRTLEDTDEDGWDRTAPRIVMHAVFTLPRPKAHYRTGKFAHLLRDNAPIYHAVKPDLDKLLRSTGDALTAAGVYGDDCRISQIFAIKTYPNVTGYGGALDRPGARITLTTGAGS